MHAAVSVRMGFEIVCLNVSGGPLSRRIDIRSALVDSADETAVSRRVFAPTGRAGAEVERHDGSGRNARSRSYPSVQVFEVRHHLVPGVLAEHVSRIDVRECGIGGVSNRQRNDGDEERRTGNNGLGGRTEMFPHGIMGYRISDASDNKLFFVKFKKSFLEKRICPFAFDIESDIFRTVTSSTSNMLLSHDSVLRIVSEIKEMNTVFERPE